MNNAESNRTGTRTMNKDLIEIRTNELASKMRKEYALEGVAPFQHWSDAYPTLALAQAAARNVWPGPVRILRRIPIPFGHEYGARWEIVVRTDER